MLSLTIALTATAVLGLAACGPALASPDGTTVPPDITTTPPPFVAPETVSVPDLTGLTLAEAKVLLGDAGLAVTALPQDTDQALVVAQEPAPGTEVDTGSVVVADVQQIPTCNPPDPLSPGPGQTIITVLYECSGDAIVPTPGTGVPRIVPESDQPVDRIEWALRSMLAGPTPDERAVGFDSAFDAATADALNGATLTDGGLVVDFNDAIMVNNMNTSTGMVFFNAELHRNVFQHSEVDSVEFRFNGDCAAWSALFESDGCRVVSRANWVHDLADWDHARNQ